MRCSLRQLLAWATEDTRASDNAEGEARTGPVDLLHSAFAIHHLPDPQKATFKSLDITSSPDDGHTGDYTPVGAGISKSAVSLFFRGKTLPHVSTREEPCSEWNTVQRRVRLR